MKKAEIAVIDYGMGNLRSVSKALERVGANVLVTDDRKKILSAQAIVFPGVGAFGPALKNLKRKKLDDTIKEAVKNHKYFLGLCLGFQLLFDLSYEEGKHKGLGIFSGEIKKFQIERGECFKIPHMGWNNVFSTGPESGSPTAKKMFNGIAQNSYFYFVHSYYGIPKDKTVISGKTFYGINFCSALAKDNIWACQFHPEKSGKNGLKLLENFVDEVEKC